MANRKLACDSCSTAGNIETDLHVLMRAATPLDQPRAIGRARISSKMTPAGTRIDGLRQSGALKLLFPRAKGALEAIIINTSGGITGGDDFEIEATAGKGSALTLTTQAAERAYKAQPDQTGHMHTLLTVESGATLHWLPQETILYNEAALHRRLEVDLAQDAQFLMVEPVLFGRHAMGEVLRAATLIDRIDIRRAAQPLYRDGVTLTGDLAATLDRPGIGAGARAMANLVWVAPHASGAIDRARDIIGSTGGASMIQSDTMVVRLLAEDGFTLRRSLVPLLDLMTNHSLPLSWRL